MSAHLAAKAELYGGDRRSRSTAAATIIRGGMHPFVIALLEALLAAAVKERVIFTTSERSALEEGLYALESRRYALEDSAICERIASLQDGQGAPTSGAP